jgi:hypothetical protein
MSSAVTLRELIRALRATRRHPSAAQAALRAFQDDRLRRLVRHAYDHVPHYRERFDREGLSPSEIRGVADLHRIPITSRRELQALPLEQRVGRGVDPARLADPDFPLEALTTRAAS